MSETLETKSSILIEFLRTKKNFSKILVFSLLLLFYSSLLLHKIDLPVADDLSRHITNGDMIMHGNFEVLHSNVYSYTEPNYPFVNHHWLFGVVVYLLYQLIGWSGLVIFKVLFFLLTFSIVFYIAVKKANFWLVSLFSIPTILIFAGRTDLRPEMFTYFFVAIFLYLLMRFDNNPEGREIFLLIPIQLLWVNTHIYFIVGILLIGGFILEKIIILRKQLSDNPLIRRLLLVLIGVIIVCFINPNGINGVLEPFTILNNRGIIISEEQSIAQLFKLRPIGEDVSIISFIMMVPLLALSFFLNLKKKQVFYFLAFIGTAIVGFLITRSIFFFGLIILPAISVNLDSAAYRFVDWLKNRQSKYFNSFKIFSFIFLIGGLVFLTVLGGTGKIFTFKKFGAELTPHSQEGAKFLTDNNIVGPIFNDFDSGSYLILNLFPKERVFVDNRAEAYPESFFKGVYFPLMENKESWKLLSEKYNFNTIFLYQYDEGYYIRPFITDRINDPEWSLVYAGTFHFIFVKNIPQNAEVIRHFKITKENVEEKLNYLVQSSNFDDQVAAADIFNLLGREDLGMATFLRVVSKWPQKGRIWMIMGEWKLTSNVGLNDPSLAVTYLEKAIDLGENTAEAYYYLGRAYYDTGQLEKANAAFKKSLKINPEY